MGHDGGVQDQFSARVAADTIDGHRASATTQPRAGVPRGTGANGGWTNRGDGKLNVGRDETLTMYRGEAWEQESRYRTKAALVGGGEGGKDEGSIRLTPRLSVNALPERCNERDRRSP